MMEVVSGDNWNYRSCKAPVKSSPPTNQHPCFFYRPNALSVAQPTVSKHWRERHWIWTWINTKIISENGDYFGFSLTEITPRLAASPKKSSASRTFGYFYGARWLQARCHFCYQTDTVIMPRPE